MSVPPVPSASLDRGGVIAVLVMFVVEPEQPEQAKQADHVPQHVGARIFPGESRLGLATDSAALGLLGGRGTKRRGGEEQRDNHANAHGVLLCAVAHLATLVAKRGLTTAKARRRKANARIGSRSGRRA